MSPCQMGYFRGQGGGVEEAGNSPVTSNMPPLMCSLEPEGWAGQVSSN